jgi:hypothetical protein
MRTVAERIRSSRRARLISGGRQSYRAVKALTGYQHRVHDDGEFPCHRDRRPLEAKLVLETEPPGAQATFCMGAREHHGRGLIQQAPHMGITAPRDVAVLVHLA